MLRAYTFLYVTFLFFPIAVIALFSFHATPALTFPFQGFSFQWYEQIFADPQFRSSLKNSILVATVTALITTGIGSFAALALARLRGKLKSAFAFLHFAPIAFPGLFLGIALLAFFSFLGVSRSLFTVIVAHILFTLPFFIEAVRSRIEYFDLSLEEAARDLGASSSQAFRKVTLPIIAPTLIGGAILTFALSFDELVITVFVVGQDTTLPVFMYSMLRRTINPTINAASVVALSLSILAVAFGGLAFLIQRRRALQGRVALTET